MRLFFTTAVLPLFFLACAAPLGSEDAGESALSGFNGLDPRFGEDGMVRGDKVNGDDDTVLAYDDADRLLLLRANYAGDDALHAVRYRPDGSVDAEYAQRKRIPLTLGPTAGELHVLPLQDGSAIVTASALCALSDCPHDFDEPGRIVRYAFKLRADGDLDASFAGGKGFLTFPSPARKGDLATFGHSLARTPKGEVVIAMDQPDGKVDVSWISASGISLKTIALSGLGGSTRSIVATETQAVLGRAGTEGDRSFGFVIGVDRATGKTNEGMGRRTAYDALGPLVTRLVATEKDIWVLGHGERKDTPFANDRVFVTKLKHDLLIDPSFGTAGTKTFDAGGGSAGNLADLRVRPDGTIVVIGTVEAGGIFQLGKDGSPTLKPGQDRQLAIFMFRANGAMDTSLAPQGLVLVNAGSKDDRLLALSSGSSAILAAGFSGRSLVLTKLFTR